MFTVEELVELAAFDAGIDAEDDYLTADEMRESRSRERKTKLERLPNNERRIKEYQAAYYSANKDKIKEYQAAYRAANKDKIKECRAAYYSANQGNE